MTEPGAATAIRDLDLSADLIELTMRLVDVPSESGTEGPLADAVHRALDRCEHLQVDRDGDAIVARTSLGRERRVLVAGHLDTVPVAGNLPARRDGERLYGCGSTDMKAADAVLLRLAATLTDPSCDLTFVLYDNEEVEAERNGLRRLLANHPDWLAADFAILMEPTNAGIEAGCQGTLRARIETTGRRAHSARSWLGENAIHGLSSALSVLAGYAARSVTIDGCTYREGLNAVGITGGVAGNVIPDAASLTVNFRFAPDRTEQQAADHVREVFAGYAVTITDSAPGALPHLDSPAVRDFVAAVGRIPEAKYGWTDVARFAALGIPAVNYGPGDPNLAHTREESVEVGLIEECARVLAAYLGA